MTSLRTFIKDWIPPIALNAVRQMRGGGIVFEGDYLNWEEAAAKCSGYDAENILAKVLAATLKVKNGEAAFERDSVLFDKIEYAWPVLSGLMWAASRNSGVLNVLDFGGALGSSYFQNRKFLKDLPEVRWNVVEQAHYVEAGQKHIQDKHLRFYPTIDACLEENQPNVVLLSSVLQYLLCPEEIIHRISRIGANCLIIDRTPFCDAQEDKLLIQHVPSSIYKASYPMWIFSKHKFLHVVKDEWITIASNLSPEGHVCSATGIEFSFEGFLLEAYR